MMILSAFDLPLMISWNARYMARNVFPVPAHPDRQRWLFFSNALKTLS